MRGKWHVLGENGRVLKKRLHFCCAQGKSAQNPDFFLDRVAKGAGTARHYFTQRDADFNFRHRLSRIFEADWPGATEGRNQNDKEEGLF